MKYRWSLLLAFGLTCVSVFATQVVSPQKEEEAWTKWSKKQAEKMLTDSPWSQRQTDTDTSEMFFSPTSDPNLTGRKPANDDARLKEGATNQSTNVSYVLRFFSARPVRRALVRLMELQTNPTPEVIERLHNFANVKADESIIITVTAESTDQRSLRAVMQSIDSAITSTLKNETYLERDGKRLFLEEYIPPGKDGFGARFIFLRTLDEKPFIADNTGEVRFHAKFPNGPSIDRRFKVSAMIYNGVLEY
ncbi:MAG TPA: hypothetical protein VLE19_02790 [Pyrinomonadaceae bacterium]|nr:hypothetical protein [Pyrinomonadaceae bacterium]